MNFLAPFGLALGGLAIPLVAMYFLRIRRKRVQVPSLLLWHALKRSEKLASPFERFRKHLLLLLQLLLLAALVLAFARPYLKTDAASFRSVVLVIDTSASMGARDGDPTRFDSAIAEADAILDGLGVVDEVMLVEAGPHTEVRLPFSRDVAKARLALHQLHVTQAEGSLREGLQLALSLARSRPDVEVVVLSDGSGEDLSSLPTGGTEVNLLRLGARSNNSGIVALDLRRSPTSELQQQLFVTVQNFGRKAVNGTVEVYLEGELMGLRTEPLGTGEPVSFVFDLAGDAQGTLRVRLDADTDLLEADNQAFAVVSPMSLRHILLLGGDKLTARALSSDPRVELRTASSAALSPDQLDNIDAVVVAAAVPDSLHGLPMLILGPHPGSPLTFGEPAPAPRILGWQRTHPLMRFVQWDGVTIISAQQVRDAAGLQSIVEADSGPLVLAGERDGARIIQLSFNPLQSDLPLRVAWPVFLLNSVGWLTEDATGVSHAGLMRTGGAWVRRAPEGLRLEDVRVDGPKGQAPQIKLSDGLLRLSEVDRVGVYDVQLGASQARFAANLLSQRESNIAPRAGLGLSGGAGAMAEASAISQGRREIWRPLLMLALLLLSLEWLAWNRRKVA